MKSVFFLFLSNINLCIDSVFYNKYYICTIILLKKIYIYLFINYNYIKDNWKKAI